MEKQHSQDADKSPAISKNKQAIHVATRIRSTLGAQTGTLCMLVTLLQKWSASDASEEVTRNSTTDWYSRLTSHGSLFPATWLSLSVFHPTQTESIVLHQMKTLKKNTLYNKTIYEKR